MRENGGEYGESGAVAIGAPGGSQGHHAPTAKAHTERCVSTVGMAVSEQFFVRIFQLRKFRTKSLAHI
jgi:hypothetical protein